MLISQQQGDAHNDDCGGQRSHHGDEFEQAAGCAQYQRVRHAHAAKKCRVCNQSECRERQLRANEVGQHLIQIVEHSLQKLALRPRLHQRKQ